MYCSPLLRPRPTLIPTGIREWCGSWLQGPPRGARPQRTRACLFAVGRIGDFVLTLGALRLLIRALDPQECVLVVSAMTAAISQREFPAVRHIVLPTYAPSLVRGIVPAWWWDRRKFATVRFEQLICLVHQRDLYNELALSWIAAEKDFRLMPDTYPGTPAEGLSTELLAHRRLVETVLGHTVSREDLLPSFSSPPATAEGRLLIYPLARETIRTLPVALTVEILRHWRKRSEVPIVLGGNPTDARELQRDAHAARQAGVKNVQVETPLGLDGLIEHIAQAGAVLAADSGPAHIATALDKLTVLLMASYYYGYCQPWRRSARQQMFMTGVTGEVVAAALPAL